MLVCLGLSACVDTPLSSTASTFVQDYHARQQSASDEQKNSYYYLLGIGADGEPQKAGKAYHDELHALLQTSQNPDADIAQLNQRHRLNARTIEDNPKIFCAITADNDKAHACFDGLFEGLDVTPYGWVHERYLTFLSNPPAIMQGQMRADTRIPNYQVLVRGQRLNLIAHLGGDPKRAIKKMASELSLLRGHLASANTLIEKMIYGTLVANQLQAMTLLKSHAPNITTPIIASLTVSELSLKPAFLSEFMMSYGVYDEFDKGHNLLGQLQLTLLYNKHKTINQSAITHQRAIEEGDLPAPQFAHLMSHALPTQPKIDWLNYIGSTLLGVAVADFHHYTARIKSLDNIINIANHQLNGTPLVNVFAPALTTVQTQNRHICLPKPKSGHGNESDVDKKFECLNV